MDLITILAVVIALGVIGIALLVLRGERARAETDARLAVFADMADKLSHAQTALGARVDERLDGIGKRLGDGLTQQAETTGKTLKELHERLAVIDAAQKEITGLSREVVGLQDILSNKQARGAFGEIQLNDLVSQVLPPQAYGFQVQLGNGKRADCVLDLPNPPGRIVIDSKFPLESYRALHDAPDEAARTAASRAFTADVRKHIKDIAERYIIPGETADQALMFLPSEAVYAELHGNFAAVVEESFKARVFIVSPTTLWATLNTIRAILKDARMQEAAALIQDQVRLLHEDIGRLDDRTAKLQSQFATVTKTIGEIRTSAGKISRHSEKIEEIELGMDGDETDSPQIAEIHEIPLRRDGGE